MYNSLQEKLNFLMHLEKNMKLFEAHFYYRNIAINKFDYGSHTGTSLYRGAK